jgi:hypothetical protein
MSAIVTLKTAKTLLHAGISFKKNVPTPVNDDVATELENQCVDQFDIEYVEEGENAQKVLEKITRKTNRKFGRRGNAPGAPTDADKGDLSNDDVKKIVQV